MEKYGRAGQAKDGTIIWRMRVACWTTQAYRLTLRICIIYCFSTATVVTRTSLNIILYRVSQEERSIFLEFIVPVILSKKLYMNMCPIPNDFRDRAI